MTPEEKDSRATGDWAFARIVLAFVALLFGAFVFSCQWGWFVVPLFGARPLSPPGALGLWMVSSAWFVARSAGKVADEIALKRSAEEESERRWQIVSSTLIFEVLTLGVGWAAHFLMLRGW